MEMVENGGYEQPSTMHYCKVCKKGFACGEALGGHMRAHYGRVDARNYGEEPSLSSFEDKLEGNKHSYFLRTPANRFLSRKAREACEKMWPHNENGKCTINEMVSPISWAFKYDENDESCASSREGGEEEEEEEELANCLVMLSNNPLVFPSKEEDKVVGKGVFQCKGCKKVFNSHQALGGHRASHKNVKGCFASSYDHNLTDDGMNTNNELLSPIPGSHIFYNMSSEAAWGKKDGPVLEAARRAPWDCRLKRKTKVHECSICYRIFPTGQALGGHKRCHWLISSNLPEKQIAIDEHEQKLVFKKPMIRKPEEVDLNFSLTSNNVAHDEAYLPTRPEEDGNEEECRNKKVEKLSDLWDMNLDGESSTWLQMGIASTT